MTQSLLNTPHGLACHPIWGKVANNLFFSSLLSPFFRYFLLFCHLLCNSRHFPSGSCCSSILFSFNLLSFTCLSLISCSLFSSSLSHRLLLSSLSSHLSLSLLSASYCHLLPSCSLPLLLFLNFFVLPVATSIDVLSLRLPLGLSTSFVLVVVYRCCINSFCFARSSVNVESKVSNIDLDSMFLLSPIVIWELQLPHVMLARMVGLLIPCLR